MFEEEYQKMLAHEGGWIHHPNDRGGETYFGISRVNHPHWSGWTKIDVVKDHNGIPDESLLDLGDEVKSFYKEKYWNRISGDSLPKILSSSLFDIAVNGGVRKAGRYLQRALNRMNRQGKDWPDILEDGKIGPQTLKALKSFYLKRRDYSVLAFWIETQRAMLYWNIAKADKTQEDFFNGWSKRSITKIGELLQARVLS